MEGRFGAGLQPVHVFLALGGMRYFFCHAVGLDHGSTGLLSQIVILGEGKGGKRMVFASHREGGGQTRSICGLRHTSFVNLGFEISLSLFF